MSKLVLDSGAFKKIDEAMAKGGRRRAPRKDRRPVRRRLHGHKALPPTVQLPLDFLTFPDACVKCGVPGPTEYGILREDISTTLQTLAEIEKTVEVPVPLCPRCGARWRRSNLALAGLQLLGYGALVVALIAWAKFDWSGPGWAWALLWAGFLGAIVLQNRNVDRRFSAWGLGVCIDKFLGDETGRAVLRFGNRHLAAEAQRLTLEVQKDHAAGY